MTQDVMTRDVYGVRCIKTRLQVTVSPATLVGDWRDAVLAIACRHRRSRFRVFVPDAEEKRKHRKNLDCG